LKCSLSFRVGSWDLSSNSLAACSDPGTSEFLTICTPLNTETINEIIPPILRSDPINWIQKSNNPPEDGFVTVVSGVWTALSVPDQMGTQLHT
jgi:hypothetical protein